MNPADRKLFSASRSQSRHGLCEWLPVKACGEPGFPRIVYVALRRKRRAWWQYALYTMQFRRLVRCFVFWFLFPSPTVKYLNSQEASKWEAELEWQIKIDAFPMSTEWWPNYLLASSIAVRKHFPASFKVTATSVKLSWSSGSQLTSKLGFLGSRIYQTLCSNWEHSSHHGPQSTRWCREEQLFRKADIGSWM